MPFHVIRGRFFVTGYSPDGDSIRFQANNPANWGLIQNGGHVDLNSRNHAQLRLEAIDTLETHFTPGSGTETHQPERLAKGAMNHLLATLGIDNVVWNFGGSKITNANDGVEGYIITRQPDKNGRPIAFAFKGQPMENDGDEVFLDPRRVATSVNAEMLSSGFAYPTYYEGLFPDLRNYLNQVVAEARNDKRGVWKEDQTNSGFAVSGMHSLEEVLVILPKLFRRLATHLRRGNPISSFASSLSSERITIISTAHATSFDTIISVNGNRVRMTHPPEDIMFRG